MSYLSDINGHDVHVCVMEAVKSTLKRCASQPVTVAARREVQYQGEVRKSLYLVESGYLHSYCLLPDGRRQITQLHQPGDIIGLGDLGQSRATCALRSLRDCVVYPVAESLLMSPSILSPGMAAFLLYKAADTQTTLSRTLVAVGRMDARQRLIWLMLMLRDRRQGGAGAQPVPGDDMIDMPFNQSEIGDLLGLTNVSVSKVLCQLAEDGFIERRGCRIRLRRLADMQRAVDHVSPEPTADRAGPFVAPWGARRAQTAGSQRPAQPPADMKPAAS